MTLFTDPLVWCVVQITLVGLLAWALCAFLRRWSTAGNAAVPATALAAIVVLTLCAFAPWPDWWTFGPPQLAWQANAANPGGADAHPQEIPGMIVGEDNAGERATIAAMDEPAETPSPRRPVSSEFEPSAATSAPVA